jgi:hypothetical protein
LLLKMAPARMPVVMMVEAEERGMEEEEEDWTRLEAKDP